MTATGASDDGCRILVSEDPPYHARLHMVLNTDRLDSGEP